MVIEAEGQEQVVDDLLVGQVWLASGQSNMNWYLADSENAADAIAHVDPLLRHFRVERHASPDPLPDLGGAWHSAGPEHSATFSAVATYFARKLREELDEPIGIITSTWGGTPAESWISSEALGSQPILAKKRTQILGQCQSYPARLESYREAYHQFMVASGRELPPEATTSPPANVAPLKTVPLPGAITGPDGRGIGWFWLRRQVVLTDKAADKPQWWQVGPAQGLVALAVNGQLVKSFQPDGRGTNLGVSVPAKMLVAGENQLDLQVTATADPAELLIRPSRFQFANQSLAGSWDLVATGSFPPLPDGIDPPVRPVIPPAPQKRPAYLYNGMIAPLVPVRLAGVIWYQGESNAGRAAEYELAFSTLIEDWRRIWGEELPFFWCQLPRFQAPSEPGAASAWAELREAQSLTRGLPRTGMAVLIDEGEERDIHPIDKKTPGKRLALLALAEVYDQLVIARGPAFREVTFEGGAAYVSFDHTEGGLVATALPDVRDVRLVEHETAPLIRNAPDGELEGFALRDAAGKWHWANARIEGERVVVWHPEVQEPDAVRYAWGNFPYVNLTNRAGLPAEPFRTDDEPLSTAGQ